MIIIPDIQNINEKNFGKLLLLLKVFNLKYKFHDFDSHQLQYSFGSYSLNAMPLKKYAKNLYQINKEDLYQYKYSGINLFHISKSEILLKVIPNDFANQHLSSNMADKKLFDAIYINYHEILISNLACACYWIDFFSSNYQYLSNFKYSFLFSGSSIFNKVFVYFCKLSKIGVFMFEHSLNGNFFYMDRTYAPISNNQSIKFDNFYNILSKQFSLKKNTSKHYIEKLDNKNLKNIKQLRSFNRKEFVLLICQVANDYALIEDQRIFNSLKTCISIIKELLKKQENIIIKTHPWEKYKVNIKSNITYQYLESFIKSNNLQSRVTIISNEDIRPLMRDSTHIITLNSQSAIEAAALFNKKCIVLLDSFFSNKGFTHNVDSISQLSQIDSMSNTLSKKEQGNLNTFLNIYFNDYLYSHDKRSYLRILSVFNISTRKYLNKLRLYIFLFISKDFRSIANNLLKKVTSYRF